MVAQPTGTVTLLFSDIEGSTRLLERLGSARYNDSLTLHHQLLRGAFQRHGGYEVDNEGDAFFVAFSDAREAVAAAADAQQALSAAEWPSGLPVRVRIGIHTGEPMPTPPKYVGLDVHKAARVMAAGHGGQVLMTEATRTRAGAGLSLKELGSHRLKDLSRPEPLYQLLVPGGRSEFPALKTLGNHPTNLPTVTTPFVGRATELSELQALMSAGDVRLLTLTGPAGMGKTRLALQAVANASDDFDHGVFWVALAEVTHAESAIAKVAETLGVLEEPGESLQETVVRHLDGKSTLLLLDNAEHVIDAVRELVAQLLIGAPTVRLVVTSREALRISVEHVYDVPPMAVPEPTSDVALLSLDALELLVARVERAGVRFEPTAANIAAATEIVRRLDGMPLAIELAAARARELPLPAIARRLDDRLGLLTNGPRDTVDRQRTLRAAIEWSYDLLSNEERLFFSDLGVFVGGFRLDAAEAVSIGRADVLDGITTLIDKSLVRRRDDADGEPRYWMLEAIREYAREQLTRRGDRTDVEARHADFYLQRARELEQEIIAGNQQLALALVNADYANAGAAIATLTDQARAADALRLASRLTLFLIVRGRAREAHRLLEQALRPESAQSDPHALARALAWLTDVIRIQGDLGQARATGERAVAIAELAGDDDLIRQSLYDLAEVELADANPAAAKRLLERMLTLATTLDRRPAGMLATVAFMEGDLDGAEQYALEALHSSKETRRRDGEAFALSKLGEVAAARGDYPKSIEYLSESLAIAVELDYREILGEGLIRLADLLMRRGSAVEAARLLGAAEQTLTDAGASLDETIREVYASTLRRLEEDSSGALAEARAHGARLSPADALLLATSRAGA